MQKYDSLALKGPCIKGLDKWLARPLSATVSSTSSDEDGSFTLSSTSAGPVMHISSTFAKPLTPSMLCNTPDMMCTEELQPFCPEIRRRRALKRFSEAIGESTGSETSPANELVQAYSAFGTHKTPPAKGKLAQMLRLARKRAADSSLAVSVRQLFEELAEFSTSKFDNLYDATFCKGRKLQSSNSTGMLNDSRAYAPALGGGVYGQDHSSNEGEDQEFPYDREGKNELESLELFPAFEELLLVH